MERKLKRPALRPSKKIIRPEIKEWHLFCAGEGCEARLLKCYGGLDAKAPLLAAELEPGYSPGDDGIWRRSQDGRSKGLSRARAFRRATAEFDSLAQIRPTTGSREPPRGTPDHRRWKGEETQKLLGEIHKLFGDKADQEIERMKQVLTGSRAPIRPSAPVGEIFLMECYKCGGLAEIELCRHSVDRAQ